MIYQILEAFVLGLVQGLTEFLPVSSSGHLELAKAIFGQDRLPEESLTLTVLLHLGTALATIGVFRKDILELLQGIMHPGKERNYIVFIIVSMIPAGLIGFFFEDSFSYFFDGKIWLVGLCLWLTAALLFISEKQPGADRSVGLTQGWWIGVAQAVALLPGVSRSGATISMALLLGIERKRAARFSFLMVIPLILGKVAKDLLSAEMHIGGNDVLPALIGLLTAFISGWIACVWMISLVQQAKLRYFALYCFIVGAIAIYFGYFS